MFSYGLLHLSDNVILLFSLLFFFLPCLVLIQNVTKIQGEKNLRNQEKPGENLKNQLLDPGDFLTRRKAQKPGFSWLNQEMWQPWWNRQSSSSSILVHLWSALVHFVGESARIFRYLRGFWSGFWSFSDIRSGPR